MFLQIVGTSSLSTSASATSALASLSVGGDLTPLGACAEYKVIDVLVAGVASPC